MGWGCEIVGFWGCGVSGPYHPKTLQPYNPKTSTYFVTIGKNCALSQF